MNRLRLALASCFLLTACDTPFGTTIEVGYGTAEVSSAVPAMEAHVVAAVRAYAATEGLRCGESSTLPIQCASMPVSVLAFRSPGGATVCYGALGIPFETAKFRRRMEVLAQSLKSQDGLQVSASAEIHSMSAACQRGWASLPAAQRK